MQISTINDNRINNTAPSNTFNIDFNGDKKTNKTESFSINNILDNRYFKNNKSLSNYSKNLSNESGEQSRNSEQINDAKENILKFINNAVDTLKDCINSDDYSKMSELGIIADKEDVGTIITVYERIQIQLAAYSDGDISKLNISSDKINEVLKSPAMANAVKMTESIEKIDDETKAYLLKNELEPTIENIYKAVHTNEKMGISSETTHLSNEQWKQLQPQVEKFLNKNGIEVSNETLNSSKWLLERDISLSVENLMNYFELSNLSESGLQNIDNVKSNMIMADFFGMSITDAYMTEKWIDYQKIEDSVEIINNVSEDTVKFIAANDVVLNVANLEKYKYLSQEQQESYRENGDSRELIKAKKIILEAKAVMTIEGAALMEKLGINITYTNIEDMLTTIKEENTNYLQSFLEIQNENNIKLFTNVMEIMSRMGTMPLAVIGQVYNDELQFTINNIHEEGTNLKNAFEKANMTYEAVGTEVRTDLGDSINKAFSNVDVIIEDNKLEINEDNRRAVRILGYNSLHITKESIIQISEKASELDKVIKNLTPKTASYLIENGINPLNENIEELNDKLIEINSEIGADQTEKYSEYLWKIEKSGNITKEEREGYIELYRIINTILEADTRAIGAVLESGLEVTLGNLYSAEKSRSKYGMNLEVAEDTGYYQGKIVKNKLENIMQNITQKNERLSVNTTLNQLENVYLTPENLAESKELSSQYIKEIVDQNIEVLRENNGAKISEDVMYSLFESNMAVTVENLIAASGLTSKGSEIRKLIKEKLSEKEKILDNFNSEEEAKETIDSLQKSVENNYERALTENDIEVQKYRSLNNVAKFMGKSAENKSYHIPIDLDGEEVIVRVKFSSSENSLNPQIRISFDSEILGELKADFNISGDKLSGFIMCNKENAKETISQNINVFDGINGMEKHISVVMGENNYKLVGKEKEDLKDYTNKELYEISKTFLSAVKVWSEMPIT